MVGSASFSRSLLVRLSGVAAAGIVATALAGCTAGGSSSTAAASSPASASAASPSAAASASSSGAAASPAVATSPASGGTSASAAPSGGGAAASCATRDLQVKVGTAEGAAGSTYQYIDFTNIGSAACTLYGYPGVSLAAGKPVAQVGAAAARSTTAGPTLVTLRPGGTGNSLLRVTVAQNYPSAACSPKTTTYLQIYPPNQTTPIFLTFSSTGCASAAVKLLTIGVVQPGAGTNQ
jgi:Protein of unknown function (DUF4232)